MTREVLPFCLFGTEDNGFVILEDGDPALLPSPLFSHLRAMPGRVDGFAAGGVGCRGT
jgi:hypothetical protein